LLKLGYSGHIHTLHAHDVSQQMKYVFYGYIGLLRTITESDTGAVRDEQSGQILQFIPCTVTEFETQVTATNALFYILIVLSFA
jgi:hypothetical protein